MEYILSEEEYKELTALKEENDGAFAETARRLIVHLAAGHHKVKWGGSEFVFGKCYHEKDGDPYCDYCPIEDGSLLRKLGILTLGKQLCRRERRFSQ